VQGEWRFYLDDMATFAKKVQTYTQHLAQAEFVANERFMMRPCGISN